MPPPPAAVSAGPFAAVLAVQLLLVAAAALAGGASLSFLTLGHRPMQVLLSLTGGVLLGVGLLHLLPHAAVALGGDLDATMGWVLAGFFGMFVLERAFHAHAHHAADAAAGAEAGHPACGHGSHPGHDHGSGRQPAAVGPAGPVVTGRWAWCGAFAGLALHGLADGAALAASTLSESAHGAGWLAGGATFLAVLLHKPFDAAIIAALLLGAGAGRTPRTLANLAYSLVVPLGAVAFLATLRLSGAAPGPVVGIAMAVAAGAFVCIAAADLLPEVQFHSHDRVLLTTSLALGLAIAWGVGLLERAAHDHSRPAPPAVAPAIRP
jgi:zinc and cadmium transporter